jgi:hypothetical protein
MATSQRICSRCGTTLIAFAHDSTRLPHLAYIWRLPLISNDTAASCSLAVMSEATALRLQIVLPSTAIVAGWLNHVIVIH